MTKYDYLVVGAGLFGATFARLMTDAGRKVLVIDKRKTLGGNCADYKREGITVQMYGAHIFHTNDETVWKFVNKFGKFVQYSHNVKAKVNFNVYSLPFNMNTFNEIWGITDPDVAKDKIRREIEKENLDKLSPFERAAVSKVGRTMYELFIKSYSEKQWGKSIDELSEDVVGRLPIRYTFDNNYFNDTYQGLPINGYSALVEKMLKGIDVVLDCEYKSIPLDVKIERKVIYCGPIDEFFNYKYGALGWRSLGFSEELYYKENVQGCPVLNLCDHSARYTRTIEYKHFLKEKSDKSIVVKEYPVEWREGLEPYYPIENEHNQKLYEKYLDLASNYNIIFAGRCGSYKYVNMDQTIKNAMLLVKQEMK